MLYELFDAALRSAGIYPEHRDPFEDRGDGLLALIHPVDQAPAALLLSQVVPLLARRGPPGHGVNLGPCQRQISVQVGSKRRLGRVFLPA